ncbi:hypothetical protein HNP38_001096 [Chryseobacterium defluvii]|uniref:Uncharacterized protein n=1 Tax=Chryseobacterium defluvii TaxID=160396 RepID=A0A840KDH4_9FLAO|nr:hypothetical protein [Chryseobacterium defluvii]MBB4805824.1 hypothetical protein [Chryseobacterium defluvii]
MVFEKELKRDYNIDVSNMTSEANDKAMEELFSSVGMLMATECSDLFLDIMGKSEEEAESPQLMLNGTITKIEKENFVVFHLVGENKTLNKLYWVSAVESDLDLPKEYNSLLNKKVNITYYTAEIFDAKTNNYRNLNVISSLKTDN